MTAKQKSRRSISPTVVLIAGAVAIAVGGYLLFAGVSNTEIQVLTQIGGALDPTAELQALTGAPGSSVAELPTGTYQVVGVGPNLTASAPAGGSTGTVEVVRRPFEAPDIEVVGPGGRVRLSSPSVNFVVDAPDADAASLVEFTVRDAGSYQLFAKDAGDGSVQRLGIRKRDDVGEVVRETVADFGRITLGALIALVGVVLVIVGLSRRRRLAGQVPAAMVMVRNAGGIVMNPGGPSATGGIRTPIAMQPDPPPKPRPVPTALPVAAAPPAPPRPASPSSPPTAPSAPPPVASPPPQPSPPPPPAAPPSPPDAPPSSSPGAEPSWPPTDWPPAQPGRPGSSLPPPPPPR